MIIINIFRKLFNNKQKCQLKQYSFVKFDENSVPPDIYHRCYEQTFGNDLFIFLGEVPNCKGHCLLADLKTGKVIGIYHTSNFRVATEAEI
jgi:hypothetical protein